MINEREAITWQKDKENGLNFIKDKLQHLNEPTYKFEIGEKVSYGNFKDCEYSCAAEPPVRCDVSHLSRRNEPL